MTEPDRPSGSPVLVFPRDANPYQSRLYDALENRGVKARYIGELTPSHSVNLLLLPAELAFWRIRRARVLHLHWVFGFGFTGPQNSRWRRRASYLWYLAVLGWARALGIHIVWTLHNVLPHQQVFPDDVRARRWLLRAADLVIAHTQGAVDDLRHVVGSPRRVLVLPHPVFDDAQPAVRRRGQSRRLLIFGRITAYKGIEETADAFDEVAAETSLELTVAGDCPDPGLAGRLRALAAAHPERVHLRLEHVPDAELEGLFGGHDVQWLAYRRSTTSGAAIMGAQMGIPLAISDLPSFAQVPGLRLGQTREALATGLRTIDGMPDEELDRLSAQSLEWAAQQGSWEDMARATEHALSMLLTSPGSIT